MLFDFEKVKCDKYFERKMYVTTMVVLLCSVFV